MCLVGFFFFFCFCAIRHYLYTTCVLWCMLVAFLFFNEFGFIYKIYIYIYSCLGGVQVQELDLPTCKWISLVFQSLAFIPLLLFCSLKFCFRYSCSPHFLELKICRDVS